MVKKIYQFEDDAVTQFESITKCKTASRGFFHFENDMRYSSSPDALRPLGI